MSEKPKALSKDEAIAMLEGEYAAFFLEHGIDLKNEDPFDFSDLVIQRGNSRVKLFYTHRYIETAVKANLRPPGLADISLDLDMTEEDQPDLAELVGEIRENIRKLTGGSSS